MTRVDVAIVGGGPAGASAAWTAAAAGAETLLLEKGVPREDRETNGPDSTDAAGILDYWVDLMDLPEPFPEEVIYQHLDGAEFIGPHEQVRLGKTGIDATYPHFGFTYDRAAFDDWLLSRAREAGADTRIGTAVKTVESTVDTYTTHRLSLRNGESITANTLILADGPQRTVTLGVLEQFLPDGVIESRLASPRTNHIAYQEYRHFPEELFERDLIKFWWGHIPGETAYPWVFPNEEPIARVGLTMPIGQDLDAVSDRAAYPLLRADDDRLPNGAEFIERLLETAYPNYDLADFPLVENRGKRNGTETYPISSTQPIDSPVEAGIAITGGAMGATSAFHEGGAHVAIRTGRLAGQLAATGELHRYNTAWKAAIGDEIRRNVALADLVEQYQPDDWDHVFRVARQLLAAGQDSGASILGGGLAAGLDGIKLAVKYRWRKHRFRNDRIVQLTESEYEF